VLFFPKGVGGLVVEQVERRRKRRGT
jgi:hypothetical protein